MSKNRNLKKRFKQMVTFSHAISNANKKKKLQEEKSKLFHSQLPFIVRTYSNFLSSLQPLLLYIKGQNKIKIMKKLFIDN